MPTAPAMSSSPHLFKCHTAILPASSALTMAEELPQEALVRLFHCLPIKQRSRLACVCKSWRQASLVDAVQVKLQKQHVPSYLHVALPDGTAQLQAAACPMMSLARSADITWASSVTGQLLESMPSLERLAFTSMSSLPVPVEGSETHSLQSFKSLKNLRSLQLNTDDAAPVLEGVANVPGLKEIELHLSGGSWHPSAFDKIADTLGAQAARLESLSLRCSHASVYAATAQTDSLGKLTGLTSLRMGPNPEDIYPHMSPLGFPKLPTFLGALINLQQLDISMADCANSPCLSTINFSPISHIRDITLTLRADKSLRAVQQLPPTLSTLSGLSKLTVQSFTFDDPGGWNTHAYFDLTVLKSCHKLRTLELQLCTWECEHCEGFQLPGLSEMTALQSLKVAVGGRFVPRGQLDSQVEELLITLPPMKTALQLHISTSARLVLRNSKFLARAKSPGILANSILLEEPLPRRKTPSAATTPRSTTSHSSDLDACNDRTDRNRDQIGKTDTPRHNVDQDISPAAADYAAQQYVRAPAHVVIGALRDLWPKVEVWQYPMRPPGFGNRQPVLMEVLSHVKACDDMQQQLWQDLLTVAAEGLGPVQEEDVQPLRHQRSGSFLWRWSSGGD